MLNPGEGAMDGLIWFVQGEVRDSLDNVAGIKGADIIMESELSVYTMITIG